MPITEERAWAEIAQVERFAAVGQPFEALARARWLERELGRACDERLERLRPLARQLRARMEAAYKAWRVSVRSKQLEHARRERIAIAGRSAIIDD